MNMIKSLRTENNLSMAQAARELDIPYTTYVNYEKGEREPNSEMLVKIATYFDVSVDYLIGRSKDRHSNASVGDNIRNRRLQIGMSVDELASAIGKNRATIYRYESSDIENIPASVIEPLSNALSTTPEELMGWLRLKNTEKCVPLIGDIACGMPILADENIEDYITVPENIDTDFALRCKGDSMINARIFDGDIVFIRQQDDVDNGTIAAVLIEDEATLKKVYKYHNRVELRAENPLMPTIELEGPELENFKIIGKAVYFLSEIR